MVRPDLENIPDAPLPEGLEVRPVKPEHLRAIWEAEQEAFLDHWGASEVEEGDFERWLNNHPFQPELWQVAWDGDQVAGMVRTIIDRNQNARFGRQRGYTENISTRRPWRKRGLARALMAQSMRLQKELGMTETALGVDASNPNGALQLYESMGFQVTKKETIYRKPL
jgi:ribosomal protein S18 acetylase RimI-like enzyme